MSLKYEPASEPQVDHNGTAVVILGALPSSQHTQAVRVLQLFTHTARQLKHNQPTRGWQSWAMMNQ